MSGGLPALTNRIHELLTRSGTVTVAIDGPCGAGKSTMGETLRSAFSVQGCNLFHMDDFFLWPFQRTAFRLGQPGGNVDRERFLSEVLQPLKSGHAFVYQKYNCQSDELLPMSIKPRRIAVIEGVYSLHPELRQYYDLKVFLDIDGKMQIERLKNRSAPDQYRRFITEWIPLEESYFNALNIREAADMILRSEEL